MRFFDAHCDTILQVIEEGRDFFAGPGLHVTLEGLRRADVRAQVFACFVLEARYPGRAREQALAFVQAVKDLCAAHPDDLLLADTPALVASAFADARPVRRAVVLALEGADPLEGEVAALREFRRLGVRLLTLAWDDNPFCGTAFGSGGGLTPKGEELVALCEELGVVVDVSHASDAAFDLGLSLAGGARAGACCDEGVLGSRALGGEDPERGAQGGRGRRRPAAAAP